jgi:acyl carrier protein
VFDEVARTILRLIGSTGALRGGSEAIDLEEDLYAAGLKSLAAVRLMVALENEFGIEFPDTVLHRGAFSTVARIRSVVLALTEGANGVA